MPILVLGLGNILLSDEGVGVRVIEALQERWTVPDGVSVVDGGTCGMDMLDIIASHDTLIVVDAVKTGAPPATVVRLTGDAVPAFFKGKLSPHQLGLSDLLATLRLHGEEPKTLVLFGCVPERMEVRLDLSPAVAARVPDLVDRVVAELRALGAAPHPNAGAHGDGEYT
ncbi:HyaD/HybD family hydrogenase maturation endopeptidase [Azospirillum halopraeferens]|uniref:HyaD/HybD family hydrogenase maturation endopeptidase n=1 Tax=Azospirillum halopraeferens TaxID=34010 RepID=UPI0004043D2E|nr:HyaD/HybD family hydrogenase maturation endopeptidase [Azospirillum halopraeferens]